jgi:preprotein translocase subunit SecF
MRSYHSSRDFWAWITILIVTVVIIWVLLITLGCSSATKSISQQMNRMQQANDAAIASAHVIAEEADAGLAAVTVEEKDNSLGIVRVEAGKITTASKASNDAVASARKSLTQVADVTPWWGNMLLNLGIAAVLVCVVVLMIYTGAGRFIRGWFTLITPAGKRRATVLAKLEAGDIPLPEAVAALRVNDPAFEIARKKQEAAKAAALETLGE